MKIILGSDLHLEFAEQQPLPELPEGDILVLAGDINYYEIAILQIKTFWPNIPVIYVPGNHDYYHGNVATIAADNRDYGNIHVLKPGTLEFEGITYIGGTLWSELKLTGYKDYPPEAYERAISDFFVTHNGRDRWRGKDHIEKHLEDKAFIQEKLKEPGKKVVVTHFLPSTECIDPFYANSNLNPYFCNNLDSMINEYKPDAWLYGHTHSKLDKIHSNGVTRLVCNPRGYPNEGKKKANYNWKVVEV